MAKFSKGNQRLCWSPYGNVAAGPPGKLGEWSCKHQLGLFLTFELPFRVKVFFFFFFFLRKVYGQRLLFKNICKNMCK